MDAFTYHSGAETWLHKQLFLIAFSLPFMSSIFYALDKYFTENGLGTLIQTVWLVVAAGSVLLLFFVH